MNKGDLTNNNENKAHARKGKSLVAKKYFSNLSENSKFTFYHQNQFFALQDGIVGHQAAQLKYE